jgi:hypothetical protein
MFTSMTCMTSPRITIIITITNHTTTSSATITKKMAT